MQGGAFPPKETDETDGENKAAAGLSLSQIQDMSATNVSQLKILS